MATSNQLKRRGLLFVLSSPSGAGKTTIARMLLAQDSGISLSVSATTRPMREGEVDGRDYHFVTDAEFDRMVESGQFLEWAHVFGRRYGTLENEVRKSIDAGCDVLLDIDWQGTQQLKQVDPDIVRVFILPPSMAELERRLRAEYDDVLVHEDKETCLGKVHAILEAERLKATRRIGLHDFVRGLIG